MSVGDVMVGGRPRRGRLLGVLAAVVLAAGVWVVAGGVTERTPEPAASPTSAPTPVADPAEAAEAFLAAWEAEDWERLQALTADPGLDVGGEHARAHQTLAVTATHAQRGEVTRDGETVRVPFTLRWELADLGEVTFDSELSLTTVDGSWRVRWWYPTLHPDLTPERRLQRVVVWPARAPILDRAGTPIVTSREQILVGVQPGRMGDDPEPILEALAEHTDADVADARTTLTRGDLDPDTFVPLVTLDAEAFAESRDHLLALPGVRSRRVQTREPEDVGAARPLVGSLGEVTGELLDELGAPYQAGDTVGRSGLERTFERQLAGRPEVEARIVEGSNLVATLAYDEGAAPEPVATTLDPTVLAAAASALDGSDRSAALVAIDAPTGEVLAATWSGDLPIALSGRYPPGSTFKIISAAALLADGADPSTTLACPPTARIGGRDFRNAGGGGLGDVDLREAFARSCNTAFALAAERLGDDALAEAAGWFGFGADAAAGLPAFGGSFPRPADQAELAAAAIGQGRVEASPLHMASVAAAARTGTWRAPRLVGDDEPQTRPLPDGIAEALDTLMRAVVETGTGTAARLDGPAVAGKTGTAEYGDASRTHAWFVGYRDDLAFAVLVDGGGAGGAVAAPLAARFLTALDDAPAPDAPAPDAPAPDADPTP